MRCAACSGDPPCHTPNLRGVLPGSGLQTTEEALHPGGAPRPSSGTAAAPLYTTVSIAFHAEDYNVPFYPHEDAFVISANVNGVKLHRILINGGSSTNIFFIKAFDEMGLSRSHLLNAGTPLWGFDGGTVQTLG